MKKKIFLLAIVLFLVVGFVPQPAEAETGSRITTYVVPAITDVEILPTSSISSDYISNEISIVAALGEYEPASFVIRANTNEAITSLAVISSDLTGESGFIPSHNVDIRVVKSWYQAGVEAMDIIHKTFTPELLLKDDSLVKVENGENYLKLTSGEYIWISDPVINPEFRAVIPIEDLPVQDSSVLLPVNIPAETNKQFWVTVKVPDDALAGIYAGKIELRTGAELMGEIQLTLEVLPIELAEPYLTYGLYYRGMLGTTGSISSEDKTEAQYRAELQNMLEHGITNHTLISIYADGKVLPLQIKNEVFGTVPLYYYGLTANIQQGEELEDLLSTTRNIIDDSAPYVSEVYIYGRGEVGVDKTVAQRATWEAVRVKGAKIWIAGHPNLGIPEAVGDILDLFVVAAPDAREATAMHSYGHQIFSYANPQVGKEKPETYRRNYGLLLWQRDFDGAFDYAYQDGFGNIWNDFDNSIYRDHVFAYPTIDGVIDTIEWEGWREAVDDIRYLTTLLNLIKEAKANSEDTSAADNWLADLKNSDLATKDLDAVRSKMIGYIIYFVGGTPSDTTPPALTSITHSPIKLEIGDLNNDNTMGKRNKILIMIGVSIVVAIAISIGLKLLIKNEHV